MCCTWSYNYMCCTRSYNYMCCTRSYNYMCCTRSYNYSFLTCQKIQNEYKGHDVAHRFYECICFFQYAIQFHITYINVISYMSITKVQPAQCQFSQSRQTPRSIACRPLILVSPKWGTKCGKDAQTIICTPEESMDLHCHNFHETVTHSLKFLGHLVMNFI